jgi:hypothetical protein
MMFILGGVKLYWTVASIPIVTVIAYIGIWIAHYYKATYLHPDMKDIQKTYMASDKTCFFVAEAFFDYPITCQPIFCPKPNSRISIVKAAFQMYPNIDQS